MRRNLVRLALSACACLLAVLLAAHRPPAEIPTTVLLVRHAERESDSADSPLSAAGLARSRALVDVAADAGIGHIYTTEYRRTRETAAPIAAQVGVEPTIVPVGRGDVNAHAREVAQRVRAHTGEVVLVVGHSNTVPLIVEALGGDPGPEISEDEYDRLYILTVPPSGRTRTIRARFGPAD